MQSTNMLQDGWTKTHLESCISNHVGINDFLVANFCNLVTFVFQEMKQKSQKQFG
jgi:hypothetical protein